MKDSLPTDGRCSQWFPRRNHGPSRWFTGLNRIDVSCNALFFIAFLSSTELYWPVSVLCCRAFLRWRREYQDAEETYCCDRSGYIEELTQYLYGDSLQESIFARAPRMVPDAADFLYARAYGEPSRQLISSWRYRSGSCCRYVRYY